MTPHYKLLVIVLCLLGTLFTSCGLNDDTTVTVDDAVTLLQDMEDRNVWETISDRLITLNDQTGYSATITLQIGPIDESGDLETSITMTVQVDEHTNAHITLTNGVQSHTYIVLGYDMDAEQTQIYRADDNGYICVTSGNDFDVIQGGFHSVFNIYGIDTFGMQTLAVVDRTDNEDAMVVGREAIEYDVVSKLEDALKIAAEFENADLQAVLDQAGQFEIGGALYLDNETLALLRVVSTYSDLATQQSHKLTFEVTQWGEIPEIMLPSNAAIIEMCD